jgi:hypothetical protein
VEHCFALRVPSIEEAISQISMWPKRCDCINVFEGTLLSIALKCSLTLNGSSSWLVVCELREILE